MVMWIGTEVVDYVPDITIWPCGVGQKLWIMYQTCGVVQRLWIMCQTYYHMVMWSGTEVVDNVPDMWSGTEVVDNVPGMWSGAEVVDYAPDITIWSCGVVQRLWIMYQTLPYGHVEWNRVCG